MLRRQVQGEGAALLRPVIIAQAQQLASVATLTVRAGPYERLNVPVVASLRGIALKDNGGELRLSAPVDQIEVGQRVSGGAAGPTLQTGLSAVAGGGAPAASTA